ncbi:MAG TPA: SpoIID/LytB domain-containing protein [Firmicutes bacterium]|nr:SpoIID/LytB domain-containing protein [Candidatus Fermentithermobacillaceae bacterium]
MGAAEDTLRRPGRLWAVVSGVLVVVAVIVISRMQVRRVPGKPGTEPMLSVYFHEENTVRQMPLETYVEGVVAAEMDPNWPIEALKAQAIVARTFTLEKIQRGGVPARGTDASTDPKEFQAYDAAKVNDRVREAVRSTRGQVITYGGKPIQAWFHASSGGKTATPEEGLGQKMAALPYVSVVPDMPASSPQTWVQRFSASEVARAARTAGVPVGDSVSSIRIGRKGPSGRAETLVINGKAVSAPALRLALGGERMRSTLLDDVRLEDGTVYMRGRGYGHGVGMSQWGAWVMALRGKKAQDIVRYYYRGVKIETMWQ